MVNFLMRELWHEPCANQGLGKRPHGPVCTRETAVAQRYRKVSNLSLSDNAVHLWPGEKWERGTAAFSHPLRLTAPSRGTGRGQ